MRRGAKIAIAILFVVLIGMWLAPVVIGIFSGGGFDPS